MIHTWTNSQGHSYEVTQIEYEQLLWDRAISSQQILYQFTPKLKQLHTLMRGYTITAVVSIIIALSLMTVCTLLSVILVIVVIWCGSVVRNDMVIEESARKEIEIHKGYINDLESYMLINYPEFDIAYMFAKLGISRQSNNNR